MAKDKEKPPPGYEFVYTTKITLRNGKVLYASQCGKKCFRFLVPKGSKKK